jgi:predicted glycoside hydrolase/deacetylase ChbG (UPF0249 family)
MVHAEADISSTQAADRSTTPIVLCADDYAVAPGVSRAICALIEKGRLSATSCMTVSPHWPEHARWLRPLADQADIGLHLTLTDQAPLGAMRLAPGGQLPPLGVAIRRAFLGQLDRGEIAAEIARQLDAFAEAFGRAPDFVDGHQHVHLLPGVRGALIEALARRRNGSRAPYLRDCHAPLGLTLRRGVDPGKTAGLSLLASGFARAARARGLATNPAFAGVYGFAGAYAPLFARFIAGLPANAIVMCHPGWPDDDLRRADTLVDQRQVEYDFLASDAMPATLTRAAVRVARFAKSRGTGATDRPCES